MLVMGVRTRPEVVRYALLQRQNDGEFNIINADPSSGNLLRIPKPLRDSLKRIRWLYEEISTIITNNPNISLIVIKRNEPQLRKPLQPHRAAYTDAAVMLAALNHNIPVECKTYKTFKLKSATVMESAENVLGGTTDKWNIDIADAIVAAHWGRTHQ